MEYQTLITIITFDYLTIIKLYH